MGLTLGLLLDPGTWNLGCREPFSGSRHSAGPGVDPCFELTWAMFQLVVGAVDCTTRHWSVVASQPTSSLHPSQSNSKMTEPSTDTELLTEHFGYPPVVCPSSTNASFCPKLTHARRSPSSTK